MEVSFVHLINRCRANRGKRQGLYNQLLNHRMGLLCWHAKWYGKRSKPSTESQSERKVQFSWNKKWFGQRLMQRFGKSKSSNRYKELSQYGDHQSKFKDTVYLSNNDQSKSIRLTKFLPHIHVVNSTGNRKPDLENTKSDIKRGKSFSHHRLIHAWKLKQINKLVIDGNSFTY